VTDKVYDNIDDLLVKLILGEASGDELSLVQQWVSLDPANERYLADFKRIWEESRNLAVHSTVSEDDAWKDFRRRVGVDAGRIAVAEGAGRDGGAGGFGGGGAVGDGAGGYDADGNNAAGGKVVIRKETVSIRAWLRVAAVFMVLLAGGWLYYNYEHKASSFIAVHSDEHVVTDTLPEGTVVTLNKQSSIRYAASFAGNARKVELEGEAFFDVTPDKNKPFLVYAKGVLIRVIGTSFNVKAAKVGTEVIVETGRVEVTSNEHTISLGAHEKALVSSTNSQPVKQDNRDDLYNYYRTNEFECNGLPLGRLVEKLNEVYKAQIVIGDNRLQDLPLTTTFRDESLDEILDVICKTLKITLVRNGAGIILK
jgi:transmembrane sensor